jgi:hypothetical protein
MQKSLPSRKFRENVVPILPHKCGVNVTHDLREMFAIFLHENNVVDFETTYELFCHDKMKIMTVLFEGKKTIVFFVKEYLHVGMKTVFRTLVPESIPKSDFVNLPSYETVSRIVARVRF